MSQYSVMHTFGGQCQHLRRHIVLVWVDSDEGGRSNASIYGVGHEGMKAGDNDISEIGDNTES